MSERGDVSDDALADVAYLARSANRVAILRALAAEPHDIRDLMEATGTSRSTASRILSEFEDRDWAERTGDGTYTVTVQGQHLVVQLDPFLGSMETIRTLDDALGAVPADELEVGLGSEPLSLQAFDDVTVYRASRMEPDKLFEPWIERMQASDTLRILSGAGPTEAGDAVLHEEMVSGRLETTGVCSTALVDQMLDPDQGHATPTQIRARHEAGSRLYRYDGSVPCNVSLFDDGVIVSDRAAQVGIDTDNDTVIAWAEAVFDRYLEAATLVTPDEMADG